MSCAPWLNVGKKKIYKHAEIELSKTKTGRMNMRKPLASSIYSEVPCGSWQTVKDQKIYKHTKTNFWRALRSVETCQKRPTKMPKKGLSKINWTCPAVCWNNANYACGKRTLKRAVYSDSLERDIKHIHEYTSVYEYIFVEKRAHTHTNIHTHKHIDTYAYIFIHLCMGKEAS